MEREKKAVEMDGYLNRQKKRGWTVGDDGEEAPDSNKCSDWENNAWKRVKLRSYGGYGTMKRNLRS